MALLDDILKWTESDLPMWQRDAARRLFQQAQGLSDEDYTELYGLLKAAHGLPNPLNLVPVRLAREHLPAAVEGGASVVLKTMRDLKHVNRIAPGQELVFSPTGMTVVYGGNATGKSGYGRVMKRACRARDQVEKVHPDAHDLSAQDRIPEATFDIEIGGEPKLVKWTAGAVSPDELSTIAVFDCHCARAYLTTEQDVAYLPYGLDVVENLANKVLPELSRRLDLEIECINTDNRPFDQLLGETAVGKAIGELSEKSDPAEIEALATLSEQENSRIVELDAALAEADPKAKAKELRLSAGRLKELARRVDNAVAWVDEDAIARLKDIDQGAVSATKAETLAAEAFRAADTLLPGTGEPVWKALFEAARRFSNEVAYPGHKFPHTGDGAVCPLCQEPLGKAAGRLARFEQYIKDDVAKIAKEERRKVEDERTRIGRANLTVGLDKALEAELADIDDSVAFTVSAFEATVSSRRTWVLEALGSHVWQAAPVLSENPRQRLRNLAAKQFRLARTYEKIVDDSKRKELEIERNELRARSNLAISLNTVLALVAGLKLKSKLERCKKDLKTKPISDKSKEFVSNAVTAALKTALDAEFTALGIGRIKTKLKERNDKGKMKYQLLLDLPTKHRLEEILSEGEQRAIALGAFFAELKLADHSGGIVFDDPVSSLDHWHRKNVAKRLVEAANRRQVIVLTHDTSFLGQLRDEIEAENIPHTMQFLEWEGSNPGHVRDGLPWEHQGYKERIDALEKAQKGFEKMPWPAYPGQAESHEMRHQYDLFRATIERVIQDVVFNGVVQRYRDWIQIRNLREVVGFNNTEYREIDRLHQRCCDVVDSHDPASAKNTPVPSAHDFGQDIEALKAVISAIKERRGKAKEVNSGSSGS